MSVVLQTCANLRALPLVPGRIAKLSRIRTSFCSDGFFFTSCLQTYPIVPSAPHHPGAPFWNEPRPQPASLGGVFHQWPVLTVRDDSHGPWDHDPTCSIRIAGDMPPKHREGQWPKKIANCGWMSLCPSAAGSWAACPVSFSL